VRVVRAAADTVANAHLETRWATRTVAAIHAAANALAVSTLLAVGADIPAGTAIVVVGLQVEAPIVPIIPADAVRTLAGLALAVLAILPRHAHVAACPAVAAVGRGIGALAVATRPDRTAPWAILFLLLVFSLLFVLFPGGGTLSR
jgi:hypothetical protein